MKDIRNIGIVLLLILYITYNYYPVDRTEDQAFVLIGLKRSIYVRK